MIRQLQRRRSAPACSPSSFRRPAFVCAGDRLIQLVTAEVRIVSKVVGDHLPQFFAGRIALEFGQLSVVVCDLGNRVNRIMKFDTQWA